MGIVSSQATDYCHASQRNLAPAIQLKNEIKTRTTIMGESTSPIIHSTSHKYPLNAAGEFQTNEAVMPMIRRQRTVESVDVDNCLPEKLRKMYVRIGSFLFCTNEEEREKKRTIFSHTRKVMISIIMNRNKKK